MKDNRIIRGFMILVVIGFSCLLFPDRVHAEEENQAGAGFTVESVIPDNQVDIRKTYFHLKIEPGVSQVIQVKVRSTQEAPVTVKLAVHDAISSSVGAIDYAREKPKLDESLKNPITQIVSIKENVKEVTVENYEEKIIEYVIQPPEETFPGVKLGSLRFVKKEADAETDSTGLSSEYAYVIALMLTEDGEQFNFGADLTLKKVDLKLSNGRKVIAATIQNDQPKVMQKMVIDGQVKKKGETEILTRNHKENFSVAPNSNFDFELPLDLNDFAAGTYVFTGKAEADGKVWNWEEEFTISQDKSAKINKETVFKLVIPSWVPWVTGGLVLALASLIVLLVKRQKKWQKESE